MSTNVERNKAILENYIINTVLPILTPDGVYAAPDLAPLMAVEVIPIFERIAKHPNYERQHLSTATEDGRVVVLMNGVVHDEPIEGTPWENKPRRFDRHDPRKDAP